MLTKSKKYREHSKSTASTRKLAASRKSTPPAREPSGTAPRESVSITAVANSYNRGTKVDLQVSWSALVAGLISNYAPDDIFEILDKKWTRDQIVAELNRFIAAAERTKHKKKEYLNSVQEEREVLADVRPLREAVTQVVRARHGKTSKSLLRYGLTPSAPRRATVATKSAAIEKAKATRAARGTKGRRQRLAVRADAATDRARGNGAGTAATKAAGAGGHSAE